MARNWKDVKTDVHAQGLIDPSHVAEAKLEIEGAQRACRLAQVLMAQERTE
ncbi:hypothetical protein [Nocardia sp. NPDC047038]|uniref:hypothetical protein n=1 Tax=Nocardia sp. NPDC047038 TaxID=3154338 RepID=UPI0033D4FD47